MEAFYVMRKPGTAVSTNQVAAPGFRRPWFPCRSSKVDFIWAQFAIKKRAVTKDKKQHSILTVPSLLLDPLIANNLLKYMNCQYKRWRIGFLQQVCVVPHYGDERLAKVYQTTGK